MAHEKEKQELVEKVSALVRTKFSGDWYRAFQHYVGSSGAEVDKKALKVLLEDAGVGNGLTRGGWASAIMDEMDTDKNSSISWDEFRSMLNGEELSQKN